MSNVDFDDGSAMQHNAETLRELFKDVLNAEKKLDANVTHMEVHTPHTCVGEYRRCGECGRLRDDPLHVKEGEDE